MYFQKLQTDQRQQHTRSHGSQPPYQQDVKEVDEIVYAGVTRDLEASEEGWRATANPLWHHIPAWSPIIPRFDISYSVTESPPYGGALPPSPYEQPATDPPFHNLQHLIPHHHPQPQIIRMSSHGEEDSQSTKPPGTEMSEVERSNVEWFMQQMQQPATSKSGPSRSPKRSRESTSPGARHAIDEGNTSQDPERPWQCERCPATFARRRDCVRHARSVHTYSKPYVCRGCNEGFVRSDARGRHWKQDERCAEMHKAAERNTQSPSPMA